MSEPSVPLEAIRATAARIAGRVHRTPVFSSAAIGDRIGTRISLKCESFQKTGSFKARGALNNLILMPKAQRRRGVVTVSAGNHAQALAWAARESGAPCTVVMPEGASPIKAEASRGYGARVLLHGSVMEAFDKAYALERDEGLTFVHPFDDPRTVAGTGTVGLEILEQVPDVTIVVVPVGGGGLIAGIAAAIREITPAVRVYGVEPEGASAMRQSLDAGRVVHLDDHNTIADGLAPPMVGELNLAIVRDAVHDVVTVSDAEILEALELLMGRARLVVEPSGAAATAALLAGRIPLTSDDRVVAVVSGANIDMPELLEYARAWQT